MTPDLTQVEAALAAEFPTQMLPPSEDAPLGQLAVGLDADAQGRERVLYLLLVPPVSDEDLYGLQFFALLPFQSAGGRVGDLALLLLLINSTTPLIGFGLSEEEGWVFFRCILPVARTIALDSEVVLVTAWMIRSLLDGFSDTIEAVAAASIGYPQARHRIQEILATLVPALEE